MCMVKVTGNYVICYNTIHYTIYYSAGIKSNLLSWIYIKCCIRFHWFSTVCVLQKVFLFMVFKKVLLLLVCFNYEKEECTWCWEVVFRSLMLFSLFIRWVFVAHTRQTNHVQTTCRTSQSCLRLCNAICDNTAYCIVYISVDMDKS